MGRVMRAAQKLRRPRGLEFASAGRRGVRAGFPVLARCMTSLSAVSEEEKKIRQDPVGTGSAILKTVFGSMK